MIFIILNEDVQSIQPAKYIDHLINELFPKYKVENMSKIKFITRKSVYSAFS